MERAGQAPLGLQALLDPQVYLDTRAPLVRQARQDQLVKREALVKQEILVSRAQRVLLGLQEPLAALDLPARVKLGLLGTLGLRVQVVV